MIWQAMILDLAVIGKHDVPGHFGIVYRDFVSGAHHNVVAFVIFFTHDFLAAFVMHHVHHHAGLRGFGGVLLHVFRNRLRCG